ncbi:MAG: 3-isopropylmalate dehydratase [Clostridiaceae bacterium BRH_c20a]|nr:MAG: 3-isopropylmalate dehydratase [Clostridiaceae bacterium BRH_c20a]
MRKIKGNAFIFGHNIDTDQIIPGRYLELVNPKEIAAHCMEGADPTFANRVNSGDIIVAGKNFGCGSSREHAPIALVNAGVGAVIADSFARIFYRNAVNLGLPLLICKGIMEKVNEGDVLEINLKEGKVSNISTGKSFNGEQLSEYALEILGSGGIKPLFKKITAEM